jgi:hypothetical protein
VKQTFTLYRVDMCPGVGAPSNITEIEVERFTEHSYWVSGKRYVRFLAGVSFYDTMRTARSVVRQQIMSELRHSLELAEYWRETLQRFGGDS